MKQYYQLKKQHQDAILFFRMGDFYEMFEEDAKIAHKILWISLTSRNKNSENPVALAWIPYHAKDKYLPIFLESGYKVAIAEQVSDPKAKGIVEREVQRIVTPATAGLESEAYETKNNPIIASITQLWENFGISIINLWDLSWICSSFQDFESLSTQLYKLSPSEIVIQHELKNNNELLELLSKKYNTNIFYYKEEKNPQKHLITTLGVKNLEAHGIEDKPACQSAASLIYKYLSENQKTQISFLSGLKYESFTQYMNLDEATIRSLDLVYNISTKSQTLWTLFGVLNETKTPMWKRFLREQILHPLKEVDDIKKRQKFISWFSQDTILLDKVRTELKWIIDIDMFLSRLSLGRTTPRDLINLKNTLISIRNIHGLIQESWNKQLLKLIK